MIRPLLISGVVELHDSTGLRINTREIAAFVEIAIDTGEGEIL